METYAPKQPASAAVNYTQAPYYGQTPPANSMPAQQQKGADSRAPKPEPVVAENAVADVAPVAQALPATAAARAEVTSTDVEELAKSVSGMNVTGSEKTMPSGPSNKLPGTGEHLIRPNNRGNRNSRVNVRYNAHANATTAPNSNNSRVYVPNSDFDFETSNAKFNKDNVLKEVVHHNDDEYAANVIPQDEEEVVIPPADDYYNRTKSFFDNISCEAKERQEQGNTKYGDNRRSKFHEERKLNVETFGQASVDQGRHRGYRGRGGHRGHRGRGGYRGGRGGGYNNRQQSTTAWEIPYEYCPFKYLMPRSASLRLVWESHRKPKKSYHTSATANEPPSFFLFHSLHM